MGGCSGGPELPLERTRGVGCVWDSLWDVFELCCSQHVELLGVLSNDRKGGASKYISCFQSHYEKKLIKFSRWVTFWIWGGKTKSFPPKTCVAYPYSAEKHQCCALLWLHSSIQQESNCGYEVCPSVAQLAEKALPGETLCAGIALRKATLFCFFLRGLEFEENRLWLRPWFKATFKAPSKALWSRLKTHPNRGLLWKCWRSP